MSRNEWYVDGAYGIITGVLGMAAFFYGVSWAIALLGLMFGAM